MSSGVDYPLEETIHFLFTTRSFATGAPTQLAGSPVLSVYEDASTTQITAGVSVGVDHDTVTGLNLGTVVATAANGYESGKSYHLVITVGTVGGVSVVGEVVGNFSINRSAALRPTVAGRTLDVSTGGEAGIDWANVGSPTTAVDLSGTDIQLADTVTTVTNLHASAATAAALATAQTDLDTITGTDGVTLATAQALYAPAKAGDNMGTASSVTGSVGSVVADVTIDAGSVDLIWDEAIAGHAGVGSTGEAVSGILVDTGTTLPATLAALNDISVADILTTQMTEAYAANGVAPTLAQATFAIHQMLMQFGISGTSLTVRQLDNTTTAFVVTLDDAAAPTDAKRV